MHTCDNPPCVNPAHLLLGTHAENQRDKALKGRGAIGERNGGGGKLTAEKVRELMELRKGGMLQYEIARRFGIAPSMVAGICTGHAWNHITGLPKRRPRRVKSNNRR